MTLARVCLLLAVAAPGFGQGAATSAGLPPFGRDTVLVYKSQIQETVHTLVIRIAEFAPDRFIEWEDSSNQGTIFMPAESLQSARSFLGSRLFESGMDTKGKNATTFWLSTRMFRDLVEKKKAKISIDGVDSWVTLEGKDQVTVEVNRAPIQVPAIRTMDDRRSERWFLDSEENPVLLKHVVRQFSQTLASVTTDRPNTLRWIKGKKVPHP